MPESVYDVIELVGTSPESWEKAAAVAVKQASQTLRDLRIAEVVQMDANIGKDGQSRPTAPRCGSRSNTRARGDRGNPPQAAPL